MLKQPVPMPAAHQGLPPARPTDPLRSPQKRRSQQPGHEPEPPTPGQPASRPRALRWI